MNIQKIHLVHSFECYGPLIVAEESQLINLFLPFICHDLISFILITKINLNIIVAAIIFIHSIIKVVLQVHFCYFTNSICLSLKSQ